MSKVNLIRLCTCAQLVALVSTSQTASISLTPLNQKIVLGDQLSREFNHV